MRIALVATVRNEEAELPAFLRSIESQTRRPDLVVVTSGRSGDMTDDILQEWEDTHHEDGFVWLPLDAGNRSFGRNEAIRFAREEGVEIIACTNAGVLDPSWFGRIVEPIEAGRADVVGGGYRIVTRNAREEAAAAVTQYTPEEAERKKFVTALSMAFTVEAWRNVGGFPEDLDTSEDTVFVQRLRDVGVFDTMAGNTFPRYKFEYAAKAVVNWRPPTLTVRGAYRTYRQFAETDRKAGINPSGQYSYTLMVYAALTIFAPLPLVLLPTSYALTSTGWLLVASVLTIFWFWLNYRARKVKGLLMWPYGMAMAIAVDIGRLRGYWLP